MRWFILDMILMSLLHLHASDEITIKKFRKRNIENKKKKCVRK